MNALRKYIFACLVVFTAMAMQAAIDFPMDFHKVFEYNPSSLSGWIVDAPAGKPSGEYSSVFEDYSPSNAVVIATRFAYETECLVWTNSEYSNGLPSDTWLITPEFEITRETDLLAFSVCVIGVDNLYDNNFSVYISETGTEKGDFKPLYQSSMKGSISGIYFFETTERRVPVTGYKGKKVRLAFVNEGNYQGIMGFGTITLASWYATGYPSDNVLEDVLVSGEKTPVTFSFQASTPVTTTSYDVALETSGGYTYRSTERRQLTASRLTSLIVKVPNVEVKNTRETFKLSITPDFNGAVPFVVEGSLIKAERLYDKVAVMEEATGTWCQYCPYGAAALGFYTDKYPASGVGNKVIGIALHDNDPMQIPTAVNDYYQQFMANQNIEGFPAICFNRSVIESPSPFPNIFEPIIDKYFAEKSFIYSKLDKVYLNPEDYSDMVAEYSVSASYDTYDLPLMASIVVVEDNVKGIGAGYSQKNAVASLDSETTIIKDMGEEWLPYLQLYLDYPGNVLYPFMEYDHVARASYPSYHGKDVERLPANETYKGKIYFPMPETVMAPQNVKVILLVTDAGTGEIVSADEMEYADFTLASEVKGIRDEAGFECTVSDGMIRIVSTVRGRADIYSTEGRLVDSFTIEPGENTYGGSLPPGICILKATGPNLYRTVKICR